MTPEREKEIRITAVALKRAGDDSAKDLADLLTLVDSLRLALDASEKAAERVNAECERWCALHNEKWGPDAATRLANLGEHALVMERERDAEKLRADRLQGELAAVVEAATTAARTPGYAPYWLWNGEHHKHCPGSGEGNQCDCGAAPIAALRAVLANHAAAGREFVERVRAEAIEDYRMHLGITADESTAAAVETVLAILDRGRSRDAALAAAREDGRREAYEDALRNVTITMPRCVVRVCEGGGPEDLAATVSVSVQGAIRAAREEGRTLGIEEAAKAVRAAAGSLLGAHDADTLIRAIRALSTQPQPEPAASGPRQHAEACATRDHPPFAGDCDCSERDRALINAGWDAALYNANRDPAQPAPTFKSILASVPAASVLHPLLIKVAEEVREACEERASSDGILYVSDESLHAIVNRVAANKKD